MRQQLSVNFFSCEKGVTERCFINSFINYGASLSFPTITTYCIISFLAYEDISFRRRGVM